jgi:hypothetical protein
MYYPLSQITPNLFTNGNELVYLNTKKPYIGHYWKTSKNKYYTGKNPQNKPTEELISFNSEGNLPILTQSSTSFFSNEFQTSSYLNLTKPLSTSGNIPMFSPNIPNINDYQVGEFRRYFCKKTNEIIYLEINKYTYNKLINKESNIQFQLYQPFNLPWQITGIKEQVYTTNKNITDLTSKNNKFTNLSEYLENNFTKYYK